MAFSYLPLLVIVLYAFNQSRISAWPIAHYTTQWFGIAYRNPDIRSAFLLSIKVGCRCGSSMSFGFPTRLRRSTSSRSK